MPTVKINEKEYEVSKLKLKHLRQISEILQEGQEKVGLYKSVERWLPFITESIQVKNPDFKTDDIEEASLDEVVNAWEVIVNISGIKFIAGETRPAEASTGPSSTDASAPLSAGRTIN